METPEAPRTEAAFEHLTPYCGCGSMLLAPGTHRHPNDLPVEVQCSCGRWNWALFWQRQPQLPHAFDVYEESFGKMPSRHRMETEDEQRRTERSRELEREHRSQRVP